MKKIFAPILAVLMVVTLVSCGSGGSGGSGGEQGGDPPPKEETVELTLDNWSEYFEFRLEVTPFYNSFDEFDGSIICRYNLYLTEKGEEIVKGLNDVAIEYNVTDAYACWYEYNLETGELVQKGRAEGNYNFSYNKMQGDTKLYYGLDLVEGISFGPSFEAYEETVDGTVVSFVSQAFDTAEFTRVQGALTVFR